MLAALALLLAACGSTERDTANGKVKTTKDGDSVGVEDLASAGGSPAGKTSSGSRKTRTGPGSTIAGVRDLPSDGITDTQIKVGVDIIEAPSIPELSYTWGDSRRFAEVVINDLNSRGGVAGRKIFPIYHHYNMLRFREEEPAGCAHYGEDAKVAVVIGQSYGHSPDFLACLARHNILYIEGGTRSEHDEEDFLRFPLYTNANWMNMTRSARALSRSLLDRGFFGTGSVVGILTFEEPHHERTVEVIKRELAAGGVQVSKVATTNRLASLAEQEGQIASAVLKFKSPPEVNRVILWTIWGDHFANAAEAQGYRPTYALSGSDHPRTMHANTKQKDQLRGLKGVGWMPITDVSYPERWPSWDRCMALMKAAGVAISDFMAEKGALTYCDVGWLLAAGAARAGSRLTPATLLAGIESLGDTFQPAGTPVSQFGPSRHDGAVAIRDFAYDEGCECLRYTSGSRRVP